MYYDTHSQESTNTTAVYMPALHKNNLFPFLYAQQLGISFNYTHNAERKRSALVTSCEKFNSYNDLHLNACD